MKRFNMLGLLSLLALVAVLGFVSDNKGWFGFLGFLGFLYYLRYFRVIPDEFFLENVRKTATLSFFTGMLSLVIYIFACSLLYGTAQAAPMAFALSFATSVIVFSIALTICEWREQKGALE